MTFQNQSRTLFVQSI